MVVNPWPNALGDSAHFVLERDRSQVLSFNEKRGPDDPRRIMLHIRPEPYNGYEAALANITEAG